MSEPKNQNTEAPKPQKAELPSPGLQAAMSLAGLAIPLLLYLLVAWLLGYLHEPTVTWPYLAGGMALALVMAVITLVMGESVIEDMLKFVMALVCAAVVMFWFDPIFGALIIGAPIGTGLPIFLRQFARKSTPR